MPPHWLQWAAAKVKTPKYTALATTLLELWHTRCMYKVKRAVLMSDVPAWYDSHMPGIEHLAKAAFGDRWDEAVPKSRPVYIQRAQEILGATAAEGFVTLMAKGTPAPGPKIDLLSQRCADK